jgi:hypothetical protein
MSRGKYAAKGGKGSRGKSAAEPQRGKSAAKGTAKPDHYTPEVVREIFARNPWMYCAADLSFDEGEQVNYDLATGLVVKAGTPDSVPLGEVVLFVPPTDGRGAFAAIFTSEEFHREYMLKGKVK